MGTYIRPAGSRGLARPLDFFRRGAFMNRPVPITGAQAQAALDKAVEQVRLNLPRYTKKCQHHSSVNGV